MEKISHKNFKREWLSDCKTVMDMYRKARGHVKRYRISMYAKAWGPMLAASHKEMSEHHFIKEYSWCVYVSGFSAATISKKFDALLKAHRIEDDKGSYVLINESNTVQDTSDLDHVIFKDVFSIFKNKRKAQAIQKTRNLILNFKWDNFKGLFKNKTPLEFKTTLPFMGPALSCQLARNLGNLEIAKPDVHLNRLAERYGYGSTQLMCDYISSQNVEPQGKIDLILWIACADMGSKK